MEKLYKELNEIFDINNQMLEYAEKNIKSLQKNILENTSIKKYGINQMYGGYFCPSLILEMTTQGFKKGKLYNNIPKNKNTYYVYELDKNNHLLRIQEIMLNKIDVEYYILEKENTQYFTAIYGNKKCTFTYSLRAIYENDKIKQFDIIQSNSLWSEQYEYKKDKIICKQYYYVPDMQKGFDKIKLYIINFKMNENKKINWLEHGEYKKGKLEIDFEYRK